MDAKISNKAIKGKDDFLFLGGSDSNDLIPHITGVKTLAGAAIRAHVRNCSAWRMLSMPKVMLIIPEAHVVYQDKLPDEIEVAPIRPVHNVLGIYGDDAIYPLNFFNDLRQSLTKVYTGNDSHWTEDAAFQTYRMIRSRLNKRDEFISKYTPSVDREVQDLRIVDKGVTIEREKKLRDLPAEAGSSVFSTGILNNGNLSIFVNSSSTAIGRCLIFGTSFSTRLVPAVTQDFAEVVFCYGTAIDPLIVDMVKPDALILEMPERFVHYPSVSVPGGVVIAAQAATRSSNSFFKNNKSISVSADLNILIDVITDLCSKTTVDGVLLSVVALIRKINSEAANRIYSINHLLNLSFDSVLLRQIMCGQYMRGDLLYWLFERIDLNAKAFDFPDVFPSSEMGILALVRVLVKSGKWAEAFENLNQLRTFASSSKEFIYYDKYLREKMSVS